MNFPNWFKIIWWVFLLIIISLLLSVRYQDIVAGKPAWFDGMIFIIWVALLLAPLFREIRLPGLSLKQEIAAMRDDISKQIAHMKAEISSSIRANISPQFNIGVENPESRLPEELKDSKDEKDQKEVHNSGDVAFQKPVVYIPRQIILKDSVEWNRDYYFLRYSVNAGKYSANLTDGNRNTYAYPGSWFFDFVIDLTEPYVINSIDLIWGSFGKEHNYITSWYLYSQKDFSSGWDPNFYSDWELIDSGGFPGSEVTQVQKPVLVQRFRIVAESIDKDKNELLNWIGMAQFNAYGEKALLENNTQS